jgi:hypothetical protein
VQGGGRLIAGGLDGFGTCFGCVRERSAAPFVATTTAAVMIINKVKQAYGKIIARPPSGVHGKRVSSIRPHLAMTDGE